MNLYKKFKGKISASLIISILFLNYAFLTIPKETYAIPVVDAPHAVLTSFKTGWDLVKEIGKVGLSIAAKTLARRIIEEVTRSTVNWINGGDGTPAFISNPGKFLLDTGDEVIGDFIQNSDLAFLCDPFKFQVSLALQLDVGRMGGLKDKIGCTLSSVGQNIQGAVDNSELILNGQSIKKNDYEEFTSRGGWNKWLAESLKPQNNAIGAYLIAEAELNAQILTEKESKTIELTTGSGALSFKMCRDTYRDPNTGNELGKSEYKSGASASGQKPSIPSNLPPSTKVETKCDVKTPGATVVDMLGFKATSDQRMNEIIGSLADGIDTILSSLANVLIKRGLEQLSKGVLDKDALNTDAYNGGLEQAWQNAQAQMDANAALINNQDVNNLELPSINVGSTTWNYSPTTPGTTPSGLGSGGGAFDQARNNSIVLINSLSRSESDYQNNYLIAQNVLVSGRAVFATSSVCNVNYNRTSSILRSIMIRNNVISNIDGIANSDRTIASIPWNLPIINAILAISNANMTTLSTAASQVNSASSIDAITTAMIPVNSTSFNTDPQSTLVNNIKTWLTGVQGMYNSPICPIDLTAVMRINSATSTGN